MERKLAKMNQTGRIVLPARFRNALGVKSGDELILNLVDGELRIFTRREAVRKAQGMLKHLAPGRSLVD